MDVVLRRLSFARQTKQKMTKPHPDGTIAHQRPDQTSVLWPTAYSSLARSPLDENGEGDWTSARVVRRHCLLGLA
eukprot:354982-Pleurochrysis_carterae.AAC.1